MSFHSIVHAISYPIYSGSTFVGQVAVNPLDFGVYGGFTSDYGSPPSLVAAAQIGNDDHFNWFQVIIADNDPLNDVNGMQLTLPYLDPPPGGYGEPDTHWADGLPWLWDEGLDPPGGTAGFSDGYNLDDVLEDNSPVDGVDDTLFYEDFPGGPAGSSVTFQTWLVSLNAGGSLHDFHEGFQWTWSNPSGGDGTSEILLQLLTPTQGLVLYNQLVGDYNQDLVVDAADYVVWRRNGGTPEGYDTWRAHFGQTAGTGSGASANATVPEPKTSMMLIVAAVGIRLRRRNIASRVPSTHSA